jgi:hypothetical protein
MQAIACPYLRSMGARGSLMAPNVCSAAARCPHLAATGVSPLTVLAQLSEADMKMARPVNCAGAPATGDAFASPCAGTCLSTCGSHMRGLTAHAHPHVSAF